MNSGAALTRRAIIWFRRDLRVQDNSALCRAVRECAEVIPLFILDDDIVQTLPPKSKRLRFVLDALENLDAELRALGSYLIVLRGRPAEILPNLLRKYAVAALYVNESNTRQGLSRDAAIASICRSVGVQFNSSDDALIVPLEAVPARKVFTPFYRLWLAALENRDLPAVRAIESPRIEIEHISKLREGLSYSDDNLWRMDFPRARLLDFDFCRYGDVRNFPAVDGTSRLSPYIRFGVVSAREIYRAASSLPGDAGVYVSELAWREFWYHIMRRFPETEKLEFQEKRRGIAWLNNEAHFEAWKEGRTGYPIVDAGMRQLLAEGWIHNRVRMIVASFLTKDLLIDWRWGDRHFFDHLVDYDETVDIGNWQWAASVGADPKPLRIFNPMLQSEKFDPECRYIKKYVPELRRSEPRHIHSPLDFDLPYVQPIVNHFEMSRVAKELYAKSERGFSDV
ncbi:MAG: cryptochrome/photolyase family protein [Deltaproteobacteria bacterium]